MKQKPIHPSMQPFLDGEVILMDKPLRWTSFDLVKKVRIATKVSKVGHAGTLDPLATGLLIVCTGKFTKRIQEFMGMEKEHTGTITLGATTPTYDLESQPENQQPFEHITNEQLQDAAQHFTGEVWQTPPIHSAIKKDGKPVYLAARKGQEVKLDPRRIFIRAFEITSVDLPIVEFRVVCSTGTYIRTLANDVGQLLGTGAHLSALRRTKIGEFSVDGAYTPESFEAYTQAMRLEWETNAQL